MVSEVLEVPEGRQVPEQVIVLVRVELSVEGGRGCAAVLMTRDRLIKTG
jgi:hypothetical protein